MTRIHHKHKHLICIPCLILSNRITGFMTKTLTNLKTVFISFLLTGIMSCSSGSNFIYSSAERWDIDDNFSVTQTAKDSTVEVQFVLKNNKTGWMSVAFNHSVLPADTVVAWYDENTETAYCWDAFNPAYVGLDTFSSPLQDTDPLLVSDDAGENHNKSNVRVLSSSQENGVTTIVCERDLLTGDPYDFQIRLGRQFNVVASYNESEDFTNTYGTVQPSSSNSARAVWDL